MQPTSIGGGHWLDAPAAASYERMRAAGCPPGITDAGRTTADQADVFRRYYTTNYAASAKFDRRVWNGVVWWRRIGMPAAAVPDSPAANHQKGNALDLPHGPREWVAAHGPAYGWISGRVAGEDWHKEYLVGRDVHLVDHPVITLPTIPDITVITGPDPLTPITVPWEDDMKDFIAACYTTLVGRPGAPSELDYVMVTLAGSTPTQVRDWFYAQPALRETVTKAYSDFLGRAPADADLASWANGRTIRQVRDGISNSAEAKARR